MKLSFFIIIGAFVISSCGSGECPVEQALAEQTAELQKAKDEIAELKAGHKNLLVHTVFFKLKRELSDKKLEGVETELKALSNIEGVKGLIVGKPASTGNPWLVSDYTFVLQIGFSSEEDLGHYQDDEFHLKVKERITPLLAIPPVVYDYWMY